MGGEREEEKHQCVLACHVPPNGEPGPKPRHMPRLVIELVTFWFAGRHSIHSATQAGEKLYRFQVYNSIIHHLYIG